MDRLLISGVLGKLLCFHTLHVKTFPQTNNTLQMENFLMQEKCDVKISNHNFWKMFDLSI